MLKNFRAWPKLTCQKKFRQKFRHVKKNLDKNLDKFRTPQNLDKFRQNLDKFRTPWFTDEAKTGSGAGLGGADVSTEY